MFGQSIEEEWLYRHPGFEEACHRLLYVTESGEPLAVLMSRDGAGRTTVLKSVYDQRAQSGTNAVMLNAAACNQQTVLKQLCQSLTIDAPATASSGDMLLLVRDEIRGRQLCGRHTTIVLDDLHRADQDLHGIVRFLSSVNQETSGAISVIVGTAQDDRSVTASESVLKIELDELSEVEAVEFLATGLGLNGMLERVDSDGILAAVKLSQRSPSSLKRSCRVMLAALEADSTLQLDSPLVEALFQETLQRHGSNRAA